MLECTVRTTTRGDNEVLNHLQNGAAPASAVGPSQSKTKVVLGNGRIIESVCV